MNDRPTTNRKFSGHKADDDWRPTTTTTTKQSKTKVLQIWIFFLLHNASATIELTFDRARSYTFGTHTLCRSIAKGQYLLCPRTNKNIWLQLFSGRSGCRCSLWVRERSLEQSQLHEWPLITSVVYAMCFGFVVFSIYYFSLTLSSFLHKYTSDSGPQSEWRKRQCFCHTPPRVGNGNEGDQYMRSTRVGNVLLYALLSTNAILSSASHLQVCISFVA